MYIPKTNATRIQHIEESIRERQTFAEKAYQMAYDPKESDGARQNYLIEARAAEAVANAMRSTLSVLFDNE